MIKKILVGILIFIVLFLMFNFTAFKEIGKEIMSALSPVFIGIILALILNAPVKLLEKYAFKAKKIKKIRRVLALGTTLLVIAGVLVLLSLLIAPEITKSVEAIKGKLNEFNAKSLIELFNNNKFFYDLLQKLEKPLNYAINLVIEIAPELLSGTLNAVINFFVGIMFGILIIVNKEGLYKQIHRLAVFLSDELRAAKFMASLSTASNKFSKFMSGQLLEALIFGLACYIVFVIFRLPYPALIALIMAIANLIPILGAYLGGGVSFIIILTVSPEKALIFAIVIVVMQQIEQFTTYPLIVGKYVGISAFWVMFAVTVGGSLFGFWGLILGVPTLAFIDNLFRVVSSKKNAIQDSPMP